MNDSSLDGLRGLRVGLIDATATGSGASRDSEAGGIWGVCTND